MSIRLTKGEIERLVGPAGESTAKGQPKKDRIVTVTEPQGLAIRVAAAAQAGSLDDKSYLVQYTHAGVKRRAPIGACNAISVADAIKAAKIILGDAAKGRDPFSERQAAKRKQMVDTYTLDKLVGEWAARGLANNKPSYRKEAPRVIRVVFKKLLGQSATTIDRRDAVKLHNALAEKSPQMAARATGYANAAYGWGIKHDKVTANPFAKLPVAKVNVRERVLSDEELRAIWRATEGSAVFDAIVRLAILVGQRRNEIAGMTWGELSPDGALWRLPKERVKNNVEHLLPLSTQAQAIINARSCSNRTSLVFPGARGDNVYNGWAPAKAVLDRRSGVSGWTLHDLRRTCATGLQKLGIKLEVTEAVLNHVSGSRGGIVGVYQKHDYAAEKRAALQAWADWVEAIVEGRAIDGAGAVVAIGARRA